MEIRTVSRKAISEVKRLSAIMEERLRRTDIQLLLPRIIFAPSDKDGRIGYFDPEQNLIVLDDNLLKEGMEGDEEATFLHELAHAVDFSRRGYSQHDRLFHQICSTLGVPDGYEKAKVRLKNGEKEKVREKVRKLIRLSESPFENESMSALKAAQRLMAEYGIKEDDEEDIRLYSAELERKGKFYFHEKMFISIITKLSGTLILREERDDKIALVAYGSIEQVEFSYETYLFLNDALREAFRKEKRKNDKDLDFFSFSAGLSSRLYERIEKENDEKISKALVLSYNDNSRRFKNIFTSSRITGRRNTTSFYSRSSFDKGVAASRNIVIPKQRGKTGIKKIEHKE